MSSVSNFSALQFFAEIDNKFIVNHTCKKVVDTRFALKTYIVKSNNSKVGDYALKQIEELFELPDFNTNYKEISDYSKRKVTSFSSKSPEGSDLTGSEKNQIIGVTYDFVLACVHLANSAEAKALFDQQAEARKAFKNEIAAKLQSHCDNGAENVLEAALNEAKETINALNVGKETKDYCVYKFGYMENHRVAK